MARFYTVDRQSLLQLGTSIGLVQYAVEGPPEFKEHFDSLFPEGVTRFGKRGLVDPNPVTNDQAIDLVFEYVRRAHYADRPSRYQAIFGWKTLEEAKAFRQAFGEHESTKVSAQIAVVEADQWFRADMHLTTLGSSALGFSLYAHLYWRGQPRLGSDTLPRPAWSAYCRLRSWPTTSTSP